MSQRIPSNERLKRTAFEMWNMTAGPTAAGAVDEGPYTSAWLHRCQPFLSVRCHMGLPSWNVRDYCVTELGYRKGQRTAHEAQYAWYGIAGFPSYGQPIHDLWDPFMEWCNKQPDTAGFPDGWVEDTSKWTYGVMATLHSQIGGGDEVGQFVWGRKGRVFREWTKRQKGQSMSTQNPYKEEKIRGVPGATSLFLANFVRALDGSVVVIDPWSHDAPPPYESPPPFQREPPIQHPRPPPAPPPPPIHPPVFLPPEPPPRRGMDLGADQRPPPPMRSPRGPRRERGFWRRVSSRCILQ